ncbi:hypothetical protein HOK51_04380 [Candidatus Woesearchaeota archaeon]|nr:hypothetical protein [Candidatus Woesearchaeota archaeon]MBT6519060.1 hypothetical protein [Candidatus Woesearchaeota archaeon]MBT7367329.1 hypothetical protein [Candidatus Woesearchaeota archaeon]
MNEKTSKAELGDIIRAEEFACGTYDSQFVDGDLILVNDEITIDGTKKYRPIGYRKKGTPWDEPAEYLQLDVCAYDESRGESMFVVEKAHMGGGGTGHGLRDIFPDGWYVEARRLGGDGAYNPGGEVIKFYQSGCFNCMVREVEVVGKAKLVFEVEC